MKIYDALAILIGIAISIWIIQLVWGLLAPIFNLPPLAYYQAGLVWVIVVLTVSLVIGG